MGALRTVFPCIHTYFLQVFVVSECLRTQVQFEGGNKSHDWIILIEPHPPAHAWCGTVHGWGFIHWVQPRSSVWDKSRRYSRKYSDYWIAINWHLGYPNAFVSQVVWPLAESTWELASSLPQNIVQDYENGIQHNICHLSTTSGGQTTCTISTARKEQKEFATLQSKTICKDFGTSRYTLITVLILHETSSS